MNKHLIQERRKAIRAKRVLSIQFRLIRTRVKGGDTSWHPSTTHDMSISGISFLSEVPYHIGDVLELHVVMSGVLDIFKGYGQVVRIEEKQKGALYLIAVKFVNHKKRSRKSKTASRARAVRAKQLVKRKYS